ncbi:hypothetical protein [Corallococcus sp. AB032C]|uniref:hypothetical protein n=1 Tax=Corallococcus sp. AB032C TaxID=2316717 RepID=UPI0013150D62|nr:hypothetical protein [Corallococcus sp. AB032C]
MPDIVRWDRNVNPEKTRGIVLNYKQVPAELYAEPFRIEFSKYLQQMSNGQVELDAVNTYTVGDYKKTSRCHPQSEYSNFITPSCLFANAWFGVYLIFDDAPGRGRAFILKSPQGAPDDLDNLNPEAIRRIPELDQKLIVYSSHEGQKNYSWSDFERDFYFRPVEQPEPQQVTDPHNRTWLKQTGDYTTIAALTDTQKTNMGTFSSIRAYTGLPTQQVYATVAPWYPITIRGSVLTRYFECPRSRFWALVYYNGSSFSSKTGDTINNTDNPELWQEFQQMFEALELRCQ